MNKNNKRAVIISVVVIALIAGFFLFKTSQTGYPYTDTTYANIVEDNSQYVVYNMGVVSSQAYTSHLVATFSFDYTIDSCSNAKSMSALPLLPEGAEIGVERTGSTPDYGLSVTINPMSDESRAGRIQLSNDKVTCTLQKGTMYNNAQTACVICRFTGVVSSPDGSGTYSGFGGTSLSTTVKFYKAGSQPAEIPTTSPTTPETPSTPSTSPPVPSISSEATSTYIVIGVVGTIIVLVAVLGYTYFRRKR